MTALLVTVVDGGAELDRLTLDDQNKITYRTGAARDIVESKRRHLDVGASDTDVLAALAGWSNGYIAIADDEAGEPAAAAEE